MADNGFTEFPDFDWQFTEEGFEEFLNSYDHTSFDLGQPLQQQDVPSAMMLAHPPQQANNNQPVDEFQFLDPDLFSDLGTPIGFDQDLFQVDRTPATPTQHASHTHGGTGDALLLAPGHDGPEVTHQQASPLQQRSGGHMYPEPEVPQHADPYFVGAQATARQQQLMQQHQPVIHFGNATINARQFMMSPEHVFHSTGSHQASVAFDQNGGTSGTINPSLIMHNQQHEPRASVSGQQQLHNPYAHLQQHQHFSAQPSTGISSRFDDLGLSDGDDNVNHGPTPTPTLYQVRRTHSLPMHHVPDGERPKCVHPPCRKHYRITCSLGRCDRCGKKWEREIAGPPFYYIDPAMPNIDVAMRFIFPNVVSPMSRTDDDVYQFLNREDECIVNFLEAINDAQFPDGAKDAEWRCRQQQTFNGKAKMDQDMYSNDFMTARLRALFHCAVQFHLGAPRSIYAVGGDNNGYTPNRKLIFSQRLAEIIDILRKNKRVVMDVVEGRGVQGFVCNPRLYDHRKRSNDRCNDKKKKIMKKGLEAVGADGDGSGRKRKRAKRSSSLSESVEEVEAGPSGRTRGALKALEETSTVEDSVSPEPTADPSTYSPEVDEISEQTYGSGRTRTAAWIHGDGA